MVHMSGSILQNYTELRLVPQLGPNISLILNKFSDSWIICIFWEVNLTRSDWVSVILAVGESATNRLTLSLKNYCRLSRARNICVVPSWCAISAIFSYPVTFSTYSKMVGRSSLPISYQSKCQNSVCGSSGSKLTCFRLGPEPRLFVSQTSYPALLARKAGAYSSWCTTHANAESNSPCWKMTGGPSFS